MRSSGTRNFGRGIGISSSAMSPITKTRSEVYNPKDKEPPRTNSKTNIFK